MLSNKFNIPTNNISYKNNSPLIINVVQCNSLTVVECLLMYDADVVCFSALVNKSKMRNNSYWLFQKTSVKEIPNNLYNFSIMLLLFHLTTAHHTCQVSWIMQDLPGNCLPLPHAPTTPVNLPGFLVQCHTHITKSQHRQ